MDGIKYPLVEVYNLFISKVIEIFIDQINLASEANQSFVPIWKIFDEADPSFVPMVQNCHEADPSFVPWYQKWPEIKEKKTFKDRIRLIQRPLSIEFDGEDLGEQGRKRQDGRSRIFFYSHS